MDHNRSLGWTLRLLAVIGAILFGALFLGAPQGLAVTPAGGEPAEVTQPTAPPEPKPHLDPEIDDLVVEEPCWKFDKCKPECPPGVKCLPPIDPCAVDPKACEPPTEEPKEPEKEPKGDVPTPNRIDAGGGSTAEDTEWTPLTVSAFALVLTGVAVGGWVLLRPEGQPR